MMHRCSSDLVDHMFVQSAHKNFMVNPADPATLQAPVVSRAWITASSRRHVSYTAIGGKGLSVIGSWAHFRISSSNASRLKSPKYSRTSSIFSACRFAAIRALTKLLYGSSKIPRSSYCLRHTYATFRLMEGVDVYFLAKQSSAADPEVSVNADGGVTLTASSRSQKR